MNGFMLRTRFFLITQMLTSKVATYFHPQNFIGYILTQSLLLVESRKTEVSVTEKNFQISQAVQKIYSAKVKDK